MQNYKITFHSLKQIENFVSWAEKIPYHMDASIGSVSIDAKSLLGMVSMGMEKELQLTIYGELSAIDKSYMQQHLTLK